MIDVPAFMTQDEIVHVPTVANLDQHHHVEQEVDFHVAHEKRRNYSDAKHNPLGTSPSTDRRTGA